MVTLRSIQHKILLITVLVFVTGCGTSINPTSAVPATLVPTNATTASTSTAAMSGTGGATRNTFVLADISDSPVGLIPKYQPLADYLAAHLSTFGVTTGVVKIAPDYKTMAQCINNATLAIYFV